MTAGRTVQSATRRRARRRTVLRAAAAGAGLLSAGRSLATTYAWTGGGTGRAWSTAANWAGAVAPVSDPVNTDVVFGTSAATASSISPAYSVHGLTFNATASSYTFDTGTLTVGAGGITQAGSAPQRFNAPVVVNGSQTWALQGIGPLTFAGGVTTGGSLTLTLNASADTALAGTITGNGNVTKIGTGTLTLTGASTYSGATTAQAGTLAIAATASVGVGGGANTYVDGPTGPTLTLAGNADGTGGHLMAFSAGVGAVATGTLTQAGGTLDAGGVLLGYRAGGRGTYNLRAGVLNEFARTQVGMAANAVGVFNQSGGTHVASGVVLGSGATTAAGTYTLTGGTLATPSVSGDVGTSVLNLGGGSTLRASANAAAFVTRLTAANVTAGGVVVDTQAFTVSIGQPLLHAAALAAASDGGVTKVGSSTLTLAAANTYTGPTTVSAGTLELATTASLTGGLTAAGGSVRVDAAPPTASAVHATSVGPITATGQSVIALATAAATDARTVLTAPSITLAGSGQVDVGNNDLTLTDTTVSAVNALAAAGFAGGSWAGPGGIASSAAAADAAHLTGVGVILNVADDGTVLYPTFDGRPATATDVLARYTLYGDANLDGTVTAADYTRLDAGFVGRLTGWQNGDFNYDGTIDGSDYALADNAFNAQAGGVASPSTAVATPAAGVAAVPEPTSLALLTVGGLLGVGRNRRRPPRRSCDQPSRRPAVSTSPA